MVIARNVKTYQDIVITSTNKTCQDMVITSTNKTCQDMVITRGLITWKFNQNLIMGSINVILITESKYNEK